MNDLTRIKDGTVIRLNADDDIECDVCGEQKATIVGTIRYATFTDPEEQVAICDGCGGADL